MDRLAEEKGVVVSACPRLSKIKNGVLQYVKNIILIINSMLRLCEVSSMKRIFEEDDMDIKSLGLGVDGNPNKKTALFLVMPDNDPSFNFIISMFYTQMFDVLIRTADFECGGALPIHVRLWADEFYGLPKPRDTEKLMVMISCQKFIYCANAAVNLSGKGIVSAGQMGNFYGELCNSRLFRIRTDGIFYS